MSDQTTDTAAFDQWCVLELMGHRRLAGRLREQEIAGEGFLRLDVFPGSAAEPSATQFYRPGAVYCITPTTEQMARQVALGTDPGPVKRWELPAPAAPAGSARLEDEYDDDEEDEDGPGMQASFGDALYAGPFGGGEPL
jgi:hypothetical protein